MPPLSVLLMAYGGPSSLDDVAPYLLDVRGHRPTTLEIIHEVRERYREIGGRSPILERTQAQAAALEAALNAAGMPAAFKAFVGMRHWHPYIKDTLTEMADSGFRRTVGLVMAPHYSRLSIGAYYKKVEEVQSPITVARIERWHLLPGYLAALTEHVRAALARFPDSVRDTVPVIFTAHSLPERILEWDDPYPKELNATVEAVVARCPELQGRYRFAYQSAAMTPDPWLGPDAGAVINELHAAGHRHALIAPIGFVCEHVEILYDVDIVFKRQAAALGMQLERIEMLNASPTLITGLADLVRQTAHEAGWM